MLKYGENPVVNNGNSKSLVPRNLTYRQKELFRTAVSNSDIISAIQSNSFTIPNAANITSDSADFTNSNVSNLAVDVIKKKTSTLQNITINDSLNITDLTLTNPQTFSYVFNESGVFESKSLDMNIGNLTIADNVPYINSKVIDDFASNLGQSITNYDRYISGLMFPNSNEDTDIEKKKFTGMLVIPAKTYLKDDGVNLEFKQYTTTSKTIYGSNDYKNSVRFTSFNYDFSRNSIVMGNTINLTNDSSLKDINSCTNLLNVEANNLVLYEGKIIAMKSNTFAENEFNNTRPGNISFYAHDKDIGLIELLKLSPSNIQLFGPIQIDTNIRIDASGIKFGETTDTFQISNYNNGEILFKIDKGTNKVSIYKDTDVFFDDAIRFYKSNRTNLPYFTLTDTILDTSANIRLSDDNPYIQIRYKDRFSIIDFSSNVLWRINDIVVDTSANYTFNQQNPFISFQTGSKLTFREGIEDFLSIDLNSLDSSANLSLLNSSPKINIVDGNKLTIVDGTTNCVSINKSLIDSSANINFLNNTPEISFSNTLKLNATTLQNSIINPNMTFHVKDSNNNSGVEKKYLVCIEVDAGSYKDIYLKNILNTSTENSTFNGKIISKNADNKIMSMTFNGFSSADTSTVTFFINHLYTSDPLWTITEMEIVFQNNTYDLRIRINNPLIKDTLWNISVESIVI